MRKKFIVKILTALMVVCLCLCCIFGASACNMIVENQNRVANQVLATVNGYGGIQMTVTRNEVLDYYSTYGSYLTSSSYGYNYTVDEAFEWCLENKIKSKYLVTAAMVYLADPTSSTSVAARQTVRTSTNCYVPKDILTWAEYYAAVYSVNSSIQTSLDSFIESGYQDELEIAMKSAIEATVTKDADGNEIRGYKNVKEIAFSDETKTFLKDEYYVNEELDTDKVKIHLVYDDGTVSADFIVPTGNYSTAFASTEAKTDSTFVISVNETVVKDGNSTYEAHTLTHTFDVVAARATRTEDEETDDNIITIDTVKVSRYATKAEVEAACTEADINITYMDLQAKYDSLKTSNDTSLSDTTEAYRQLIESLTNAYKSIEYYYDSSFESAALSAVQHEIKKAAVAATTVTDQNVLDEYSYLYEKGKNSYVDYDATEQDALDSAFATAIKSGIDTLYYYPAATNLSDYFFVYQILLSFSDEQAAFIKEAVGSSTDEELLNYYYEYMLQYIEVKESNPDYDLTDDDKTNDNPYVYADGSTTAYKSVKATDIMTALETELGAIYAKEITADYTAADRSAEALECFLGYVYKYNDDTGVMNTSAGYVIVPEGQTDPNSFYEAFMDLAYEIWAADPTVGNAFGADGKLAYNFTPYGVHIEIISMTPFAGKTGALSIDDKLAYLQSAVNIDGDTLYETIYDNLITNIETTAYTKFTNEKVASDVTDDESIVKIDQKAYDDMMSDYTGK